MSLLASRATLVITGFFPTAIGVLRMTDPIKTYQEKSGIKLTKDPTLLNEMRGIGALMVCGGLTIMSGGVWSEEMALISHVVAVVMFWGFALGRGYSMKVDGRPHELMVTGFMFDAAFGAANFVVAMLAFS